MKAFEARKIAEANFNKGNNLKISEIEHLIKKCAEEGEFSCLYHGDMSEDLIHYFKRKLYRIKCVQTAINKSAYFISW